MTGRWRVRAPRWIAAALLLALSTACAGAPATRSLRVGVYENAPEVFYDGQGQAHGIFIQILQAIARREGWTVRYVPGTLPQGLSRLASGSLDLMVAVARTPERDRILAFPREPVLNSWSQVYVDPASNVRTLLDLAGKRVSVPAGTKQHATFAQLAKDFAVEPKLVTVDDFDQAVDAVTRGEADAVVTNPFNGAWMARSAGLKDTAIMFAPMNIYFAGSRRLDPAVLDAIDNDLGLMKSDPRSAYFEALRQWAPPPVTTLPPWVKWAAAGAGTLTLLVGAWAGTLQYASARLRASETLQRHYAARLAHVFDHSADVICVLDARYRYLAVSRAAQRLWGHAPSEMQGRSYLDFVPAWLHESAAAEMARIRGGRVTQALPSRMVRKDGTIACVQWSAVWFEERQEMYCIGRDDTERRHLIASLQARGDELEAANNELRAFTQMVSHDLRAPVAAVTGFLGKVMREAEELPEQCRSLVQRSHAAALRMDRIIVDMLRLAQVARQDVYRQPCDLTALAGDVVASLREAQPARAVECVIEPGLQARADPQLLHLALGNLIGNAWKFSSRTPAARVEIGREPGPQDVFYVRDNGAGFDMEHSGRLFEPFKRLHASTEFEGLGIGLSIVQRVVARHGGRIWAMSAPGAGAIFRFTLGPPARPPTPHECW